MWFPRLLSHARSHDPSTTDCVIDPSASSPPLIDTVPTGGPAITVTTASPLLSFAPRSIPPCPPCRHPKSSNPCPCSLTTAPVNIINPITAIHISEPLLSYETGSC